MKRKIITIIFVVFFTFVGLPLESFANASSKMTIKELIVQYSKEMGLDPFGQSNIVSDSVKVSEIPEEELHGLKTGFIFVILLFPVNTVIIAEVLMRCIREGLKMFMLTDLHRIIYNIVK